MLAKTVVANPVAFADPTLVDDVACTADDRIAKRIEAFGISRSAPRGQAIARVRTSIVAALTTGVALAIKDRRIEANARCARAVDAPGSAEAGGSIRIWRVFALASRGVAPEALYAGIGGASAGEETCTDACPLLA